LFSIGIFNYAGPTNSQPRAIKPATTATHTVFVSEENFYETSQSDLYKRHWSLAAI